MRILGIDPGLRFTGFGVIEQSGQKLTYIASGVIKSGEGSLPHIVVNADKVLADPASAGADLARFVGVKSLQAGDLSKRIERGPSGLPNRFAEGHWQAYADVLGDTFAKLPS